MAGIGWKLQRMIDRDSLAGTVGAYLTGVAVTSAPWLLTTAVLMSLRIAARAEGTPDFLHIERIVTVVYAVTVILSAPIHVVVSRYTADRLYDKRLDRIAAPLWRSLALTLIGFALVGVGLMFALGVRTALGVAGALLTVIVGAQWLLLSVGGGMSSPMVVLRAFGIGAPLSIAAALLLDRTLGFGPLGYLYGFELGQLFTLVLLLHGTARAIPDEIDESAQLLPAFSEYRLLAISAFAYYLSIWADKVLVWIFLGRDVASPYAAAAAIAWFSVIPAFGWIYVQIETAFYRRFRSFYGSLEEGAPLPRLQRDSDAIAAESGRILWGAALVQFGVTLAVLLAAPNILALAGLTLELVGTFRWAVVGAALQVMSLLAILLLYYFDLRREALSVSLVLLVSEIGLVTAAHYLLRVSPAAGYAAASGLAALAGLVLVQRRLRTLLVDTFQSQPFSNAV